MTIDTTTAGEGRVKWASEGSWSGVFAVMAFQYKLILAMTLFGVALPSLAQHDRPRDPDRYPQRQMYPGSSPFAPGPSPGGPRAGMGQPFMFGGMGNSMSEHRLMSGHRVFEGIHAMPGGGTLRAVRYGHGLTGVVEHPMKPGYSSRTYVQGGRVLYARVYHHNTFQRYGHSFSYQRLVPAVGFGVAYYAWAARPWSAPVTYRWQWDAEPWHRAYGNDFTPYSNYSSLDEWLTDYVVAQNLRNAYENGQAEKAPVDQSVAKQGSAAGESASSTGPRPYWDTPDDGRRPDWDVPDNRRPYWEEQPSETAPAVQPKKGSKKGKSTGSQARPSIDDSPPQLPGQVKAELNAQIKRQLAERQTPAAASVAVDLPDSLKPGHTLFRVSTPLDVASKGAGQLCSLRANDYIERTGDMDQNGMVPVKVKVGGASDCAIGLATRVSVNDLEAMDSEQQQALTDALLAASKNMGSKGLPQAPGTQPMLLAAGQTNPSPDAAQALGQLQ
jgi:hypothetical protein